jgi:hypothetical protein
VKKGWRGPAQITEIAVFIYNRPAYKRDDAIVEMAQERLMQVIQTKEAPDLIAASGGIEALRRRAEAEEFFL